MCNIEKVMQKKKEIKQLKNLWQLKSKLQYCNNKYTKTLYF